MQVEEIEAIIYTLVSLFFSLCTPSEVLLPHLLACIFQCNPLIEKELCCSFRTNLFHFKVINPILR